MDMEMDLPTSDVRWNSKPKKKYELSLKKIRNKHQMEHGAPVKRETERRLQDEMEESGDSQNFKLRLSESFVADNTCEKINEKVGKAADNKAQEVILISDSSDDGTPEKFDWMKFKSTAPARGGIRKSTSAPNCVYIVKSSDSEDSDGRHGQSLPKADSVDVPVDNLQRKCSIAYTSDEDTSEEESEIFSHRRENVYRRGNKSDEPSEMASKYFQDSEKKLMTLTERFRGVFRDENSVESESGIDGDKRKNVLYIGNNREENKSRVTPTTTRNDQDRKICSSERFRGNYNDGSRLDTDSGISSTKKGNIFNGSNDRDNVSRVTPTITRNDTEKKLISSSERYRGNYNDASRLDTDSGIDSAKRGNLYNRINDKENNSRTTPTVPRNVRDTARKLISSSERSRGILTDNACNIDKRESSKTASEIVGRVEEPKRTPLLAKILAQRTPGLSDAARKPEESRRTPISAKITSRTTIPSNKDTRELLQSIRSSRYETPKVREKPCESEVSDVALSESENLSPEPVTRRDVNTEAREPIVIAETDSDSESEKVIRGSRLDASKPHKTHVTRFLDPAISEDVLSEKKKLEVAKWLLTSAAADSRSDSSLSNVSGTQGGSPNSGNSSLERLEQNYETPNNRGKLRQLRNVENPTMAPNSVRSDKSSVRQTRIDDFVIKSRDGTSNILTPISSTVSKKRGLVTPAAKEATANLDIMDCADILDNLYGTAWREKANEVLPSSEPRRPANVPRKDKGVQTERKFNPRSRNVLKKTSESSSHDDEFDAFVRHIKPNLNSTKKPATTTSRRRCSFVCDSSSSGESGGETTYLTALTNPRISNNLQINKRPTPQSLAIQRARAICDPDTEDEDEDVNKKGYDYRKQLSFSDDEDSSTSEYDPTDAIPPKTIAKPVASKTPKDKPSKLPVSKPRLERTKTFLESLCATVPIQEAHPDAKKYRQNFKGTKDELCKHLYKLFNDKVFDNKLPKDMSVEWNVRMRGTAGFCYNKRSIKALGGVTRSSRIVLATKILDTPDRLRDTLVHEMCHAAAWLINEVSDGHGPFWKGWASKAMKAFPELPPIRRCHDYKIQTKFTYRCTGCGYSVGRHSKSLDIEKKRCGHCYGKFELLMNKVTKSGTVQVRTPTSKQPTGFALFVKENYHSVKKDRQGAPHKEVMQILGQQFSAIKITKKANNSDDNNSDTASKP